MWVKARHVAMHHGIPVLLTLCVLSVYVSSTRGSNRAWRVQVSGQPQLQHVGEPPYAQPHKLSKMAQQPVVSNASMVGNHYAVGL